MQMGSGGGPGGGGGGGGPGGGGPPPGGEGEAPERPRGNAAGPGGHGPTLKLTLSFTTSGTTPFEVEIREFSSLFGNFVVRPDKITLSPGASVEVQPMYSQLGYPEGEIPISVVLRHAGQEEKQILVLRASAAEVTAPAHP